MTHWYWWRMHIKWGSSRWNLTTKGITCPLIFLPDINNVSLSIPVTLYISCFFILNNAPPITNSAHLNYGWWTLIMGDGRVQLKDPSLQPSCTHQMPLNRTLYKDIKIDSPHLSHGDIPSRFWCRRNVAGNKWRLIVCMSNLVKFTIPYNIFNSSYTVAKTSIGVKLLTHIITN